MLWFNRCIELINLEWILLIDRAFIQSSPIGRFTFPWVRPDWIHRFQNWINFNRHRNWINSTRSFGLAGFNRPIPRINSVANSTNYSPSWFRELILPPVLIPRIDLIADWATWHETASSVAKSRRKMLLIINAGEMTWSIFFSFSFGRS